MVLNVVGRVRFLILSFFSLIIGSSMALAAGPFDLLKDAAIELVDFMTLHWLTGGVASDIRLVGFLRLLLVGAIYTIVHVVLTLVDTFIFKGSEIIKGGVKVAIGVIVGLLSVVVMPTSVILAVAGTGTYVTSLLMIFGANGLILVPLLFTPVKYRGIYLLKTILAGLGMWISFEVASLINQILDKGDISISIGKSVENIGGLTNAAISVDQFFSWIAWFYIIAAIYFLYRFATFDVRKIPGQVWDKVTDSKPYQTGSKLFNKAWGVVDETVDDFELSPGQKKEKEKARKRALKEERDAELATINAYLLSKDVSEMIDELIGGVKQVYEMVDNMANQGKDYEIGILESKLNAVGHEADKIRGNVKEIKKKVFRVDGAMKRLVNDLEAHDNNNDFVGKAALKTDFEKLKVNERILLVKEDELLKKLGEIGGKLGLHSNFITEFNYAFKDPHTVNGIAGGPGFPGTNSPVLKPFIEAGSGATTDEQKAYERNLSLCSSYSLGLNTLLSSRGFLEEAKKLEADMIILIQGMIASYKKIKKGLDKSSK